MTRSPVEYTSADQPDTDPREIGALRGRAARVLRGSHLIMVVRPHTGTGSIASKAPQGHIVLSTIHRTTRLHVPYDRHGAAAFSSPRRRTFQASASCAESQVQAAHQYPACRAALGRLTEKDSRDRPLPARARGLPPHGLQGRVASTSPALAPSQEYGHERASRPRARSGAARGLVPLRLDGLEKMRRASRRSKKSCARPATTDDGEMTVHGLDGKQEMKTMQSPNAGKIQPGATLEGAASAGRDEAAERSSSNLRDLLEEVVRRGASDLHITPASAARSHRRSLVNSENTTMLSPKERCTTYSILTEKQKSASRPTTSSTSRSGFRPGPLLRANVYKQRAASRSRSVRSPQDQGSTSSAAAHRRGLRGAAERPRPRHRSHRSARRRPSPR